MNLISFVPAFPQIGWARAASTTTSDGPGVAGTRDFVVICGPHAVQLGTFEDWGTHSGTVFRALLQLNELSRFSCLDSTSSGGLHEKRSVSRHVHELRHVSGLTWQHLASLMGVTRRAVHLWASGKPMSLAHETKLHRLCAFVHKMDRGEPHLTRAALLSTVGGRSVIKLLRHGKYEEVEKALGRVARKMTRPSMPALSPQALAERRPTPPGVLLSATDESRADDTRLSKRRYRRPRRAT